MQDQQKEFIRGYNACIQNLTVLNPTALYLAATLLEESGFSREEFEEAQRESGFQEIDMKNIYNKAFN